MQSMDLFWEALYDYHKWNQKTPFYLVDKDWEKYEQDLVWYFRNNKWFDIIEETLFNNVEWSELLDVWCATAYYFPILEKKVKNIEWIDISELAIKVAVEKWNKNVRLCNIFDWNIKKQYDIITLMWNNLSIWWDIKWTKKLIWILKRLLKKNWKILSIFKKEEDDKYFIWKFTCEYNWKNSDSFKWIRINLEYLEELLNEQWLKLKVLEENDYWSCLEIKHT